MTDKSVHEGRNVKRLREIFKIKQETLASELGLSQQAISAMEQKEKIDEKILEDVAKVLKVPVDAIRNFDEEATLSIINNTFHDNSALNGILYNPTFNPLDKVVELYERILKEKDEKIAMLEKMVKK